MKKDAELRNAEESVLKALGVRVELFWHSSSEEYEGDGPGIPFGPSSMKFSAAEGKATLRIPKTTPPLFCALRTVGLILASENAGDEVLHAPWAEGSADFFGEIYRFSGLRRAVLADDAALRALPAELRRNYAVLALAAGTEAMSRWRPGPIGRFDYRTWELARSSACAMRLAGAGTLARKWLEKGWSSPEGKSFDPGSFVKKALDPDPESLVRHFNEEAGSEAAVLLSVDPLMVGEARNHDEECSDGYCHDGAAGERIVIETLPQ